MGIIMNLGLLLLQGIETVDIFIKPLQNLIWSSFYIMNVFVKCEQFFPKHNDVQVNLKKVKFNHVEECTPNVYLVQKLKEKLI